MRGIDGDFFTPIGQTFMRCGYCGEVGRDAVFLYSFLHTYIWRKFGEGKLGEFVKEGHLVAYISQKKLEELSKISGKTLRLTLKALEDRGWIKILKNKKNQCNVYVLGERIRINGVVTETLWADLDIRKHINEWIEGNKAGVIKDVWDEDQDKEMELEGDRQNLPGGTGDSPYGSSAIDCTGGVNGTGCLGVRESSRAAAGDSTYVTREDRPTKEDKDKIDKRLEKESVLRDSGESHPTVPTSLESVGSIGNDDVRSRLGQLVNKAEAVKKHAALRREVKIAKITVTPQKELTKENVVSFVDLWKFLRKSTLENFKDQKEERFPMRMDGKNIKLMKKFMEDYGGKVAAEYVEWACKNWKKIIVKFKLNAEVPTVAILWGFRESLIPMIGKSVVVVGKNQDEYDEEQAKECPDAGWGQFAPESKGKDFANG